MKPHLQCAEQQVSRSNLTKNCACHAERLIYLISITYETSFTMRGATGVTIQPHQILRLSRRKTRIPSPHRIWNVIYSARSNRCHHPTSPNTAPVTQKDSLSPHRIWNVIYSARSNRCHEPTSPNTAPATKNDSTALSSSHMKRHFQCAEQQVSLSNLTKYCACHEKWRCKISKKISKNRWILKRHFQCGADPTMIRPWSENDPSMIREWSENEIANRNPPRNRGYFSSSPGAIFNWKIQRFAPNLTFKPSPNTAPATKSATWTSPNTAPATKSDTWTSPSTAPATKSDTWTSPNTAPATKNDSTAVSSSHMKRHFQCAEQQVSLSNLPKYCTCHEKWHCKMSKKISRNRWNVISNAGPIRPWCENDPSVIREWSEHENANRNPPRNRGYFSSSPRAFSIEKYNVSRPILHSNLHQILHLPRKVTLELHQVLRLPRKVTLELHQVLRLPRKMTRLLYRPHIWNVISNARSNRCHYPTSPNTALATKNDTARCQRKSPKTGETSFPMRGRSDHDPRMIRAWSENDPSMKTQTATRLATEVTFRAHHEHFLLKNTTFRAQSYIQTFTKYCACHEKWRLNFTKYCACHEKWHLNFTKYCACHEKWHLNFTKYCACHEKWHLNFTKYCTCHEKWHLNFTKYCACQCTVTELYCTLLYLTLLYLTLLYVTPLYLALLYLLLFYLTLLYLTYSTWFYSTWH